MQHIFGTFARAMNGRRQQLRLPRQSRTFLWPALAEGVSGAVFAGAVLPFAGVLARRMGASAEALWLLAISPFFGYLLSFAVTRLCAYVRWGRLMALLRILTWAPLFFLAVYGHHVSVFVVLLMLNYMVGATSHAFFQALFREHVRERFRAGLIVVQRVVKVLFLLPIAWGVGRLLDAEPGHASLVFAVSAVFGVALALPYWPLKPRASERRGGSRPPSLAEEWRVLVSDRPFRVFMLAFFVGTLAEKIGMPILPIYFADVLDLRYEQVGLALGVAGPLLATGGFVFWGMQTRRRPLFNLILWAMILKSLRPILWAAAPLLPEPFPFVVIGEGIFRWMVAGIEMGAILAVLRFAPAHRAHLYVGIHYALLGIRGLIGPAIGWGLYRLGVPVQGILVVIAAVVLLGAFSLWRVREWVGVLAQPPSPGPK